MGKPDVEPSKKKDKIKKNKLEKKKKTTKKKKKTKKKAQDTSTLPEEEIQRRELQRQIQELVIQLKQEGKPDSEISTAKEALKRKKLRIQARTAAKSAKAQEKKDEIDSKDSDEKSKDELKSADESKSKDDDWREKKAFWDQTKKSNKTVALGAKHDIVVIPICWRGRHDHLKIVNAAQEVKDLLTQQGLDAWLDTRRQYTPGQKFAYWEHLGLKCRIEIGPEDLENMQCKVCKHGDPGDYQAVVKVAVPLPPQGNKRLLVQLKRFGMEKLETIRDTESDDEEILKPTGGNVAVQKESGDAMDENFVLPIKKKKRKT